ncbi:MAG TPA: Clp protease N-terminal domain-containing protein [Ktedonobacterales bacterium]
MRRRFGFGGGRLVALSVRAYRALLLAYPPGFRRDFGDEMARAFRDSCREALAWRGPPALAPLWLRTLRDLAGSAAGEWRNAPAISQRRAHPTLRGRARRRRSMMSMRQRENDPFQALRQFWRGFTRPPRWGLAPAGMTYSPNPDTTMRDRFDKFTERAKQVLACSQEEAQRLHHSHIGPEHLLLGLMREGDGIAAKALRELGVDLDVSRERVELIIGRGHHNVHGEVGLTPRAKRVIELAVEEHTRLNHHYVGTEHLLLGLIREGDGIAAGVLKQQGVKLEDARAAVLRLLGEHGA